MTRRWRWSGIWSTTVTRYPWSCWPPFVPAMAAACAGPDSASDGRVATVVNAAEGLPLLVEDLLATGDLGGLPPRFADTVGGRLGRLHAGQRRVLEAAALLGR